MKSVCKVRQGKGGVVAVGKGKKGKEGMGMASKGGGVGGGDGCRLASCQVAPAAGPCQSKLPNEKL